MNAISQIRKIRDTYEIILENGIILNVPELFVLDFDGADGISYRNAELNISVDDITIAASLEAETQTILLNQLNDNADGVFYITSADAEHLQLPADFCSTIYVGDTDDLDVLGGAFSGITETTGAVAVANKADNAFVLTNRIGSVEGLAAVIAHEAGHLAGTLTHDYTNNGISIDDFMNHPRVVILAGQSSTFTNETFSGLTTTSSGGAILNRGFTTINSGAAFSGNSASKGGAIDNEGYLATLNISGATFTRNSAHEGGAIFNYSATLNISGTTFTGNSAYEGGAIYYKHGSATITGATFTGNSAYSGGAIYNAFATLNISSATFNGNSADYGGAAIFNYGSATITGATFTGNSADSGGAIYNAFATLNISGATFTGNSAYEGGAIYNELSATITGATFTGNSASRYGGAIINQAFATLNISGATFTGNSASYGGAAIFNYGSATITGATFSGNWASYGGTVYNIGSSSLLNISGATFTGNSASRYGGAIYNAGSATLNISGTTFSGNRANHNGGAIYNSGTVVLTDAAFLASTDTIKNEGIMTFGGTITLAAQLQNCGQVTLTSGTQLVFDLTSCTSSREYIFIKKESVSTRISGLDQAIYEVHVNTVSSVGLYTLIQSDDSTFESDTTVTVKDGNTTIGGQSLRMGYSGVYNGILYSITTGWNDKHELILTINVNYADRIVVHSGESSSLATGSTYTNPNMFYGTGAVAEVQSGGTLTANNVTFSGNSATFGGGAVYNAGSTTFSGATFSGNSAKSGGGAIYNAGSATLLNITGTTFTGNSTTSGGAIFNAGFATFSGATFSGNSAKSGGGAIYNAGSATLLNITGTTFTGNSTTSGGAIFNAGPTTINSGAAFSGNRASCGGAVFNDGSATLNIFSGAAFSGNRASYGGTVFNDGSATLNISGATFSGNRADYGGAAIFNAGSTTINSGATFTGNSAEYGGAIGNDFSATLNISGATFSENRADDIGGAIYNEGSATITNATFNGNRIDAFEYFDNYAGGAVYNAGSATLNISGATFTGNYAFNVGGAIYNAGSATITGAIFSGNSADMGGAAIYNAGSATITNATFNGNSAWDGGAIFNDISATLNISGATFSDNDCGAIYNIGTINLKSIADLQTDTDTWFNDCSFVNWDLTAGTASYGTIRNFQYYSNADTSVTQKITVGNTQNSGIYTLATGDMSDWDTDNTGKYNFNITGVSGLPDVTITIGETKTYNGLIYALNIDNNGTPDVATDDKLVLALDNGTTGFINTSYTGASGSTTPEGFVVGTNAFTRFDAAIDAGKTNLIQTGGTYGNGSDVAIFTAQGKILTVQTAAYNTNTILAGGKHSNTAASRIWVYESGATNLTIDAGTFRGNVIGADVCTTGSQQRTGDVNMTIHGGNFTTSVAGGMYYRSSTHGTTLEQKLNSVCLIGNVNLAIDGGSFNKRVYGGNYASNDNWGGQTLLDGSINLTIDASDAITFSDHVIAGSRGEGCISGNVNVTVTGNGANLNFANGKYLFGASGAAYYKTSGGARSDVSYVDGSRNLVFDDFQGQFSGKISMFQKITFSGDTQMSFKASQNVSLSDISSWELNWDGDVETYADLTGVTNTFAGDTVNINFDSASTDDVLLTGAAGAFASLTSATVKFNDTQVAFDSGANGWVSGSNKLYISNDGTQLKMTTIA